MSVRSARYNRLGLRSPKGTSALPRERDAWAFLDAAGITSSRQQEAVITLVRDLKQARLWTKMKAIYPFIGGTASSHKWNLINPQDTNAAFRLTFSGGITHSTDGMQGNGTNGYADTNYNPALQDNQDSWHRSLYCRTSTASDTSEMGIANATGSFASDSLLLRYSPDTFYAGDYSTTTFWMTVSNTDAKGYYISTRRASNDAESYKNGASVATSTRASSAFASTNILIASQGRTTGPTTYSPKQLAFASIGDGLTDAEATLLYNAVDRYQKFLGRAV